MTCSGLVVALTHDDGRLVEGWCGAPGEVQEVQEVQEGPPSPGRHPAAAHVIVGGGSLEVRLRQHLALEEDRDESFPFSTRPRLTKFLRFS